MLRRCWILALITVFCGCGPAKQAAEPVREPPRAVAEAPRVPPDDRPVIVAFGDSLTAGFGLDPGQSYPDHLQELLDAKGYRYRVVNQGISGDTTNGGASRIGNALELKPEVVILELGANDGLRGLPVAESRANLTKLVDAFQGAGAKVVLAGMTLPRNYGADYIRGFEAIFGDLKRQKKVVLIPFFLQGVAMNPQFMQGDAMHPNNAGTKKVAEQVFVYLEPLLKK